ncbi:acid protease [Microthyrium microscopicum]|uniref:Acid protease n=1 Tax=Microthyrium microscopicum TaxID=703497 RepID=A0A6A6TZJ7_9PEZI|nr:acid protease [Microthyrium microscopicum]
MDLLWQIFTTILFLTPTLALPTTVTDDAAIALRAKGLLKQGIILKVERPKKLSKRSESAPWIGYAGHSIAVEPAKHGGLLPSQVYKTMILDDPTEDWKTQFGVRNIKDHSWVASIRTGVMDASGYAGPEVKFNYPLIDLGSSDTWLAGRDPWTKCERRPCSFGRRYERSKAYTTSNKPFNFTYGDNWVSGVWAEENMFNLRRTFVRQQFGHASLVKYFDGNDLSDGMLGVGFASSSAVYNATRYERNEGPIPLFTNLLRQKIIKQPIFSLTLNRAINKAHGEVGGGVLTFGGLPVQRDWALKWGEFTSTPMQMLTFAKSWGKHHKNEHKDDKPKKDEDGLVDYRIYQFKADSINRGGFTPTFPKNAKNMTGPITFSVDLQTPELVLPKEVAEGWITHGVSSYPKPRWDKTRRRYIVGCHSETPGFGIKIEGTWFWVFGQDLILKEDDGQCSLAIKVSEGPLSNVLGAPFFKSVMAVFDIGEGEMRFAPRIRDINVRTGWPSGKNMVDPVWLEKHGELDAYPRWTTDAKEIAGHDYKYENHNYGK